MGHRISDGRALYIEVKLPGEEPREDQRKFLDAMRRTGAIAGVAHSIEEALKIASTM
jgi:Rad3-related DNA helicase